MVDFGALFGRTVPLAYDADRARRMRPKEKLLRGVRSNIGLEVAYRKALLKLIDEMGYSITYWVTGAYNRAEPELAQDELASSALRAAIRKLTAQWNKRFEEAAGKLAEYFALRMNQRSDAALRKILKEAGFSVEFRMTRAQRDVLNASVNENVALIKSIPQQYLMQVEGMVMRSVQSGRDIGQLAKDLQSQLGVTKRRAALIARDQNNKVTAALTRARQIEVGITEAIWVHSAAGKTPRPSHVKAGRDKVRYDPAKGWYDPHERKWILPGELINCRCFSRPVIKGFS